VSGSLLDTVLGFAGRQIGDPYQYGGTSSLGWDCSGLVQAAFAKAGINLPRTAADQYAATSHLSVSQSQLQPGDLVFFGSTAATIHHVAIYVGGGQVLDAPHTGAKVRVESLAGFSDYFGATRPTGNSGGTATTFATGAGTTQDTSLAGKLGQGLLDVSPLGSLLSTFNVSGWQDLAERFGLIMLGALLLIVGVVLLVKDTSAGHDAIGAAGAAAIAA
jgi:hypothetical protein